MRQLNSLLTTLLLSSSCFSQGSGPYLSIEEIKINGLPIVKGVDTTQKIAYYVYIDQSDLTEIIGEPDDVSIRISESYETEIVKLTYGSSHVEFYDSSFGEGLSKEKYELLSVEINDSTLWLTGKDQKMMIGKSLPDYYSLDGDDDKVLLELRRGKINQVSDYVCTLKFKDRKLQKIVAYFD